MNGYKGYFILTASIEVRNGYRLVHILPYLKNVLHMRTCLGDRLGKQWNTVESG